MKDRFIQYYNAPIGLLEIVAIKDALVEINFLESRIREERKNAITESTILQLREYFLKKRKNFNIPMHLEGTPFRQVVWRALQDIPYGKVVTYKDIAIKINNPKSCRAVGQANHVNPIPILIPCHRVIGTNKKLVGYGGGLHIKEHLLKLEKD